MQLTEQQAGEIQQAAQMMRGTVLNEVIFIERLIDEYITRYFCSDPFKKNELFERVICEFVEFDVKRNLLEYLLKTYEKSIYDQNAKILKDMNDMMVVRNKLAHWMIDTSDESYARFKTGEIRFIRFKNKTDYFILTNTSVAKLNDQIKGCRDMMYKLLEKTNPEPSK